MQGDPVLQLPVQAAILMVKEGVQRASVSELHHQDRRSGAGGQQAHQAGVSETTQDCQFLEKKQQMGLIGERKCWVFFLLLWNSFYNRKKIKTANHRLLQMSKIQQ